MELEIDHYSQDYHLIQALEMAGVGRGQNVRVSTLLEIDPDGIAFFCPNGTPETQIVVGKPSGRQITQIVPGEVEIIGNLPGPGHYKITDALVKIKPGFLGILKKEKHVIELIIDPDDPKTKVEVYEPA